MCILCATPKTRLTYCFICDCATEAWPGAPKRGGAQIGAPYSGAALAPSVGQESRLVACGAAPRFFDSRTGSRRYTCPPCFEHSLGVVMDAMEKIVSLCKRRGFIFPSSEIYGGLNGAWDYGPLGVELKRNLKQAWWDDMVAHH